VVLLPFLDALGHGNHFGWFNPSSVGIVHFLHFGLDTKL